MRGKLIGYSAVYQGEQTQWFIPHQPGPGNFYGRVWPTLREAARAAEETGPESARIVAVYEIADGDAYFHMS